MGITPAERQRTYRERRQAEINALPKVACACGCGTLIPPVNKQRKPARYAHGHNPSGEETRFEKGQKAWNKGIPNPAASIARKGKHLIDIGFPLGWTQKRTATRLAKNGGVYTKPEAIEQGIAKRPSTWRENITAANRARDMSGTNNPMYGHHHSKETRDKLSEQRTGQKHHGWAGGTSMLPYGPEFTKRFKRMIRDRDGNRCVRCGAMRNEGQRALEVHHIDHNKMNNDPTNLITVCGSCNVYLSYHRDESLLAFPKRKMLLT